MATKKPAAKPAAKKPAPKKAAPAKASHPTGNKAVVSKKAAPAKKPVAKPAAKKAVAKPAPKPSTKKSVKPITKKPAAKSRISVTKSAAKPVNKTAAPIKQTKPLSKNTSPAKPVAKKAPAKPAAKVPQTAVAKVPAKKTAVKAPVKSVKTPLVPIAKTPVKPVTKAPIVVKAEPAKAIKPAPAKPTVPKPVVLPKINTKTSRKYEPDFTKSVLDQAPPDPGAPIVMYSDNDLSEFRELIQRKLGSAKKELVYLQGLITRKDGMGGDEGDNRYMTMEDGSLSMEREQLSQMASRQITFIDHLEKALMRIENKTYGVCRVTGKLIDKARLRAVPHATLSIEAKMNSSK